MDMYLLVRVYVIRSSGAFGHFAAPHRRWPGYVQRPERFRVYWVHLILLCAAAIKIKDERFHAAFAIFATAFEVVLILRSYMTIG